MILRSCVTLSLCLALTSCCPAQILTSWSAIGGGEYSAADNWSPSDAPDTPDEAANFALFGAHEVLLPPSQTEVADLNVSAGEVTLASNAAAEFRVSGDVTISGGNLTLAAATAELEFAVAGSVSVGDGSLLSTSGPVQVVSGRTEISAGVFLRPTELRLESGASSSLGNVLVAETGEGRFEGALTLMAGSSATARSISIATTGAEQRHGVVQVVGGALSQSGMSTLTVGASAGDETTALLAVFSGGLFETGAGASVINATGKVVNRASEIRFRGDLTVDGGIYEEAAGFAGTRSFEANSQVRVTGGGTMTFDSQPLEINSGTAFSVEGVGAAVSVNSDISVDGRGLLGLERGTVHGAGDFRLGPDGSLLQFYAADDINQPSRLTLDGAAQLDGGLLLAFAPSVEPSLGDGFAVLQASGGVQVDLAMFESPELASGLGWELEVVDTTLWARVVEADSIPGDYNQDGQVDAADYTVWRDTLGQTGEQLAADGNGDHAVDSADLAVWKSAFGSAVQAAAVPEPSSLLLGVLAAAAFGFAFANRQARTSAT